MSRCVDVQMWKDMRMMWEGLGCLVLLLSRNYSFDDEITFPMTLNMDSISTMLPQPDLKSCFARLYFFKFSNSSVNVIISKANLKVRLTIKLSCATLISFSYLKIILYPSSHLHILTSAHPHICPFSYLQILTSAHSLKRIQTRYIHSCNQQMHIMSSFVSNDAFQIHHVAHNAVFACYSHAS